MKIITAIIRPEKLADVLEALFKADVRGLSISRAQGHGGEIVQVTNYRGTTAKMELHEKVRVDIGVSEPFVDVTVQVLMKAARTGEVGDGKIFVIPVEKVYRIRTGEEDVDAVTPPMIEGSQLKARGIALLVGALALTMLSTFAQPAPEPSTTVFLVRHAEKEAEGADPSLNEAGRKRAKELADMLADAGITAIFSSEFHRTQQTAAPLAERLGLKVTVIPGKDIDALVARVLELKPGGRALIVGHSNTVPTVASRLTGAKAAEMSESDFDRLYVATFRGTGPGDVVILHYGALAGPR